MGHYFSNLNYTLANEDTTLEYLIVKKIGPKKILSVCGSGGRSLPLISFGAEELIAVDISPQQLELLDLRVATIKELSYQDYLKFWGFAPYHQDNFRETRHEIFHKLQLSESCRIFFFDLFTKQHFRSILYNGKWEKTFALFSKLVRFLLRDHAQKLFSFTSLESQQEYLRQEFPWRRWHIIMQILGNKSVFNALLYKGNFVKKNIEQSYFDFYQKSFHHLLTTGVARNNFFLQLCFWGEILFPEGNVIEAQEELFSQMKASLLKNPGLIKKFQGDLIESIKQERDLNFISMSDVPSYFSGNVEKNFLQEIKPSLAPQAIVVIRSYLKIPQADREGFTNISADWKNEIEQEKVNVYQIEVLRYDS